MIRTGYYGYDKTNGSGSAGIGFRTTLLVKKEATEGPQTYTVSFNANGGNGSMSNQSFTHGVTQNLSSNSFTKPGYTFAGWATSAGGSVAYVNRASYTATLIHAQRKG
jgi:hypothetical protein